MLGNSRHPLPSSRERCHGGSEGTSCMGRCAKESRAAIRGLSSRTPIDSRSLASRATTRRRLDRPGRLIPLACFLVVACLTAHASDSVSADRIVILKSKRTLTLYSGGKELRSYKIALGGQPIGSKTRQGDHRTPEGIYRIDSKNAHSRFH